MIIPREARFINLSRGDHARIAKGRSNLDLPIYFSKVSAQLPSNKAKSRPLTVAHRAGKGWAMKRAYPSKNV